MRVELALAGGDVVGARAVVATMPEGTRLRAYALYNLGVAERAAGDMEAARVAFASLASMRAADRESADLVQRAMLAVAYIDRASGRHGDARAVLEAVPASGRYRDPALASWGATAMANGDFELAARIWLTLTEQSHWTASTAQARLGFPLSLDRLDARSAALTRYREAEASFEARLERLAQLRLEADDPVRIRALLGAVAAPAPAAPATGERAARAIPAVAEASASRREPPEDATGRALQSWRSQLGHTDWLEWLASESVHRLLAQWRELKQTMSWLDAMPGDVDAFAELAAEQTRRGAEARRLLVDEGLLERHDELAAQVGSLAADLEVLAAGNGTARPDRLATPDEQRVLARIETLRTRAEAVPEAQRAQFTRRLDRLTGLVSFAQARERAARLRMLATRHAELAALLADVDARAERLERAEAAYTETVAADFDRFRERAAGIRTMVAASLVRREELIAQELRAGIDRETVEMERYLVTARIAIARATDQLADAGPQP
jgi:hypothetical protein